MNAMVLSGKDVDPVMLVKVMKAISLVESGGKDLEVHPDGYSFGRYGVTRIAVAELIRLKKLPDREYDLTNPDINKTVAMKYLVLMYERYGTWWVAVGRYHGGGSKRREEYAARVFELVGTTNEHD